MRRGELEFLTAEDNRRFLKSLREVSRINQLARMLTRNAQTVDDFIIRSTRNILSSFQARSRRS